MTSEQFAYLTVAVLCLIACVQGTADLVGGLRFHRYVRRMVSAAGGLRDAAGGFAYQPPAAVFLPCCGVDEKLEQTVAALGRQKYGDYEVIFTFESLDDPAHEAVGRWTRNWTRPGGMAAALGGHAVASCRRVTSGRTDRRSQKIHNLLAAVGAAAPDREALVFLDSDAVPGEDWLGHLVAPLRDERVGAATGYRWYSAAGGIAAGVRCTWNASTVTLLHDEKRNFCWGGATALRRRTFEALQIARRWDRALSDDLQVTLAVRAAKLRICFVPQAMVSSSDRTTLRAFWAFARRQLVITRVCTPAIWRRGFVLLSNYVNGGAAAALLFFGAALGWIGGRTVMFTALAAWALILALAVGKAALRQAALRLVLHPPSLTWRDALWDVLGTVTFAGPMYLGLFLASLSSRRIVWRNTEYELVSAEETRVVRRLNAT